MSAFRPQPKGFATKAIHVGQEPEQWSHRAVIPPLVMSTTFKQPAPAQPIVSKQKNTFFNHITYRKLSKYAYRKYISKSQSPISPFFQIHPEVYFQWDFDDKTKSFQPT